MHVTIRCSNFLASHGLIGFESNLFADSMVNPIKPVQPLRVVGCRPKVDIHVRGVGQMRTRQSFKRAAGVAMAVVAIASVISGCGSSSSDGSDGSTTASGTPAAAGGIADAKASVAKYAANPPLEVSPLPSAPKASTYAIQVNCTIPACAPGAMKAAMSVLGWKFEEKPYDISKGPSALLAALTQAIAAKPDVIIYGANFPEASFQQEVDRGTKEGIKFIDIGGALTPGYAACIQCRESLAALGALAANIALADAGAKTEIAVASDDSIAPLKAEVDGIKQEVAKNGEGSKVSDVPQSISATPAENASRIVSFLQRNPNVKYLIATSQLVNPAALKSAGLGSRVKLVGMYPLSPSDVATVKSGQVLAYSVGELGSLYWRAADAAARAVAGVKIDPIAPIQSLRVMDKTNADVSLMDPANYQDIYTKAWQG